MRHRQILTGQPPIEAYIQHILLESSGVSADPDQQPPFGRLSDDGVKRTASSQIAMEKCRGRGSVQYRKHLFSA
jgi:hypothetical protein